MAPYALHFSLAIFPLLIHNDLFSLWVRWTISHTLFNKPIHPTVDKFCQTMTISLKRGWWNSKQGAKVKKEALMAPVLKAHLRSWKTINPLRIETRLVSALQNERENWPELKHLPGLPLKADNLSPCRSGGFNSSRGAPRSPPWLRWTDALEEKYFLHPKSESAWRSEPEADPRTWGRLTLKTQPEPPTLGKCLSYE